MIDLFDFFDSIDGARYCHYSDELGVLFVWYGGRSVVLFHRYNPIMEPIESFAVGEGKEDNPTREEVHDEIIDFINAK